MSAFILILAFFAPNGALTKTMPLTTFATAEECEIATQPALQAVLFSLDKQQFEIVKRGGILLRTVCVQGDKS